MEGKEKHTYTSTRELTRERLMDDIAHELADPKYAGRMHARNDVYRDGCRGPLCRYRERTRKREARDARTRALLPGGVQPVRRVRCEQNWDKTIEETLEGIRTLGTEQWLAAQGAMEVTVSIPTTASAAIQLVQSSPPRVPTQRIEGQGVRA